MGRREAARVNTGEIVDKALVLRTCNNDMTAYRGFKWPESGHVECPDWDSKPDCGNGLHGLLWGEGAVGYLSQDADAKWLVVEVDSVSVVWIDGDKVKFPSGSVVYCGDRSGAVGFIQADPRSAGKSVAYGTATAEYRGTATAGDF